MRTDLEQEITRCYFRMERAQSERMGAMRLWHPELVKWRKGEAPPVTAITVIIREAMDGMGFGAGYYDRMVDEEQTQRARMCELAQEHPLWQHFELLERMGTPFFCGQFITAGGDVERAPTVAAFWRGMGLDIVNGEAPRRVRGKKEGRRIPCYPHVSRIGEQIRQQIVYSHGPLRQLFDEARARHIANHPDHSKMRTYKGGARIAQKILYSCLWREWRLARRLPAPDPYAFAILRHADDHLIRIDDLYDPKKVGAKAVAEPGYGGNGH